MQRPIPFGEELRRRRINRGLTLADLASLVHYSKSQLSKVERGLAAPNRNLARLCDSHLDAAGALIRLVPGASGDGREPYQETTTEEEVWLMRLSVDGHSRFQPVGRRQVLAAGAASIAGLGIGSMSIGGTSAASTVGNAPLLEVSRSLFDQYRQLGQSTSPTVVLPVLIAQTHTLREAATLADPPTRDGLLRLGSRYAEYVGWLVQETGDEQGALWWTRQAVTLATAGGDRYLAAWALVRRALVTLYRDDAAQTINLAQRAQEGVVPPRIHGLAAQREAQGHAIAGDYDRCMRSLDRARELLAREADDTDAPVIGTTNLSDPVAMITGWCLYDLGRPHEAAQVLDRELARVSPRAARTQARYGMRRALAYAAAGEMDHACALARDLLGNLITVSSATIAVDLRALTRVLSRHPRNAQVRALSPELGTALRLLTP